ncbi:hypothetical protein JCM17960_18510 [Magnetospira thiophila]
MYIIHRSPEGKEWCVSVNGVLVSRLGSKSEARRMVESLRVRNAESRS